MIKRKENLLTIGILIIVVMLSTLLFSIIFPAAKPHLGIIQDKEVVSLEAMKIVALGDSLTEGVGDSTESGGYVPLLKNELSDANSFESLSIKNNGKAGDTTVSLNDRINNSEEIQENIKNAGIIVITIGANDLMKVVKSNLLKEVTLGMFDVAMEQYTKDLSALYSTLRSLNPDAPIYHLGIYNPYYKVFAEIEQMQIVADNWNKTTEKVLAEDKNAYFVPISDQMQESDATIDSLLSEDDFFHPNDVGYQIIAKAFRDKIMETKETWN